MDINILETTHKKSKNAKTEKAKIFVGTKTSEKKRGECMCVKFEIKKSYYYYIYYILCHNDHIIM